MIVKLKILSSYHHLFNCSDKCFKENRFKKNICIEYCNQSEYKYGYYNYCYQICPNTTFVSNKNEYLCLDKDPKQNYYYDKDKNVYKECYNSCKKCNEGGNETINNCIE